MGAPYKTQRDSFMTDSRGLVERNGTLHGHKSYEPAPGGRRIVVLLPADAPRSRAIA